MAIYAAIETTVLLKTEGLAGSILELSEAKLKLLQAFTNITPILESSLVVLVNEITRRHAVGARYEDANGDEVFGGACGGLANTRRRLASGIRLEMYVIEAEEITAAYDLHFKA